MSKLNIFVPLTKIDEENRLVYGVVAAEEVDNSGEVFDYERSKPYFQKWSANAELTSGGLSKGNLREMHGKTAAGKLTDLSFDDDRKVIECCAKVVDDMAWKKCLEGVYTGFSMGGRYAEKWVEKASGLPDQKRYAGDPAEISLVDKPCIKTATFDLVKADGIVEERHFVSVIDDTGDELMKREYVPTNDELAARGMELAKAAGKDSGSWLEFADEARASLIAEKADKAPPAKEGDDKKDGDADEGKEGTAAEADDKGDFDADAENGPKPGGEDDGTKPSDSAKEGDDKKDAKPEAKEGDDKKEGGKPFGKSDNPEQEQPTDADAAAPSEETAEKSDSGTGNEVEQGWRAKDGSFHLKKADALAVNDKLNKAAEEPETLMDAVNALSKAVHGDAETGEEAPEGEPEAAKPECIKYAEFIEGCCALLKADDADGQELNKSMYSVERLARSLREVGSLTISVSQEQKREGDDSSLPGMLGVAVGQLGDTLVEMAKEEVDELMLMVAKESGRELDNGICVVSDCYYELAASTLGLEKSDFDELAKAAGAKKAAHVQGLHDRMTKMGAKCNGLEKTDGADDLNKMDGEMAELRKRAEDAENQIAEALPLIKTLMADVEMIKKLPQPSAPRTSILEKAEDGKGVKQVQQNAAEDLLSKFTPNDLAMAAIKMGQQNGVTMTARGTIPHRQGS